MSKLTLSDVQKCTFTVVAIDGAGNPAPLDGAPQWSAAGANPEVIQLVPSNDGLSCVVVAAGPLGTAQVTVTGDALIGDGVVAVSGVLDVEVTASQATQITINASAPEPK